MEKNPQRNPKQVNNLTDIVKNLDVVSDTNISTNAQRDALLLVEKFWGILRGSIIYKTNDAKLRLRASPSEELAFDLFYEGRQIGVYHIKSVSLDVQLEDLQRIINSVDAGTPKYIMRAAAMRVLEELETKNRHLYVNWPTVLDSPMAPFIFQYVYTQVLNTATKVFGLDSKNYDKWLNYEKLGRSTAINDSTVSTVGVFRPTIPRELFPLHGQEKPRVQLLDLQDKVWIHTAVHEICHYLSYKYREWHRWQRESMEDVNAFKGPRGFKVKPTSHHVPHWVVEGATELASMKLIGAMNANKNKIVSGEDKDYTIIGYLKEQGVVSHIARVVGDKVFWDSFFKSGDFDEVASEFCKKKDIAVETFYVLLRENPPDLALGLLKQLKDR